MTRADVFVVCFDLSDKTSLSNVNELWKAEIEEFSGAEKPRLLAGLKSDEANNSIDKDTIELNRAKGRYYSFCETSAKSTLNIESVFESCVSVYFAMEKAKKELGTDKCSILTN